MSIEYNQEDPRELRVSKEVVRRERDRRDRAAQNEEYKIIQKVVSTD